MKYPSTNSIRNSRADIQRRSFPRPEPFKYLHFPESESLGFKVELAEGSEQSSTLKTLKLITDKPIKGIVLDVESREVRFSDQAIDLFPGDPQTIRLEPVEGKFEGKVKVKTRFLDTGALEFEL